MRQLINALKSQDKRLASEGVYTFTFSLVELDKEREPVFKSEWSALPFFNSAFGVLSVFKTYEEAEKAASDFLDSRLRTALGMGYRLRVAPKHIDDEHHETIAFARLQREGGREFVMKVRVKSIIPEMDYWMF